MSTNPFDSDYHCRGRRWAGSVELPDLKKTDLILETGCGNGKTLGPLREAGYAVIGLDCSRHAVRLAGPSRGIVGDIRALPFPDACFDVVFCRHVLGHLTKDDRRLAAEELQRVLRPGGTLYFTGFSREDFRYGHGVEIEPHSFLKGDGIMTHYFAEEELYACFSAGDLEIAEERWQLRVRTIVYPRSELRAVMHKSED